MVVTSSPERLEIVEAYVDRPVVLVEVDGAAPPLAVCPSLEARTCTQRRIGPVGSRAQLHADRGPTRPSTGKRTAGVLAGASAARQLIHATRWCRRRSMRRRCRACCSSPPMPPHPTVSVAIDADRRVAAVDGARLRRLVGARACRRRSGSTRATESAARPHLRRTVISSAIHGRLRQDAQCDLSLWRVEEELSVLAASPVANPPVPTSARAGRLPRGCRDTRRCRFAGPPLVAVNSNAPGAGQAVDDAVQAAEPDVGEQVLGVARRIARQRARHRDANAERAEGGFVGWQLQVPAFLVRLGLLAEPEAGVRIGSGQPDDPANGRQLIPLVEHHGSADRVWPSTSRRGRSA